MGKPGVLVALRRTEYVCKFGDLVQRHRPKCSLAACCLPPEAPTHGLSDLSLLPSRPIKSNRPRAQVEIRVDSRGWPRLGSSLTYLD